MSLSLEAIQSLPPQERRRLLAELLKKKSTEPEIQPLSHGQQALWFLHCLDPESSAYNVPFVVRLRCAVDRDAFRRTLQKLVDRHASLRTTYSAKDGKPVQVVHRSVPVQLVEIDVSAWPEERLRQEVAAEAHRAFDLERGPVFRVHLFSQSRDNHILVLNAHHIAVDFWSLLVLTDELGTVYPAERNGDSYDLSKLETTYGTSVRTQRERLGGPHGEQLLQFWARQLSGELPLLNLPADRPRPTVQSFRGSSLAFEIGTNVAADLKAVAARYDVTLNTLLLAAFQVLLKRHSGQDDVIVGVPTAGRQDGDLANLTGYFVNPVAIRADLSDDPPFAEFVRRVWQTTLQSLAHAEAPFPWLVEKLQPVRDPSRSPVFQAMFVLQKPHRLESAASFVLGEEGARMNLGGLELESLALEQRAAQFDVLLMMIEAGGRLVASLQYNTDLFDRQTIKRMAAHFETLLAAIAADPECKVSGLPMLDKPERQYLIEGLNATSVEYNEPRFIHQLFEAEAASHPDAPAVIFEGVTVSYGELNARANQLAHWLQAQGVTVDTLVGVSVERSVEMVVALMAIVKAGGAYVPVDPEYPLDRQKYLLADSGVTLVLTQEKLRERLESNCLARLLCLDSEWEQVAEFGGTNPICGAVGANLAYMIYTSGSTGRPKGAMNTHEAILNRLLWMQEAYQINASDRVLQKTPFSFDVSVWEFFWPLMTGAALVVARPGGHRDSAYLAELIEKEQVTTLHFVPSMLQQFVEEPGLEAKCRSLRRVICSGEALPWELERRFYSRLGAELHNLYGPTEAAVDVTYWACPRENERGIVPIGRPIANTQIYVLDGNLEPVPVGVAGEVHIGGINLARGYWGRAELTAEKFIPNPFGAGRLYKTGDLGRWNSEGAVEYLGRLDHQVKIRGFRIELGEIETALREHASVKDAVVIARGEGSAKRLVGYVVAEAGAEVDASELRTHLKVKLPEYMVPWPLVTLEALPLSPNGKLDRRALPEPEYEKEAGQGGEPKTALEQVLAAMWAEVLGLERVGVDDNFFELGGHSLLATQLISRVRARFEVDLPLRAFFESPTIARIAQLIEAQTTSTLQEPVRSINPAPRDAAMPLSFAQQRLWFLQQMEPESHTYNIPIALRLEGTLDVLALERSVNGVIERHEILRTCFPTEKGEPIQRIAASLNISMPEVEVTEDRVREMMAEEAREPFDLTQAPLLRTKLLRIEEQKHILLLTMHHIISDGWSLSVLVAEISELYNAATSGRTASLNPLPIQYADYTCWQREWLSHEVREKQVAYWKQRLADAAALELRTDHPRPAVQTYRGAVQSMPVPSELMKKVADFSRQSGLTPYMTMLAAFQVLLHRHTGQDDIVVGTPVANRSRRELESLIGFFVNTLAIRGDLSGDPMFAELLSRTRESVLSDFAHQDLPFEELIDQLRPARSLNRTPLVQVMFIMQNTPIPEIALSSLKVTPLEPVRDTAKFELSLCVDADNSGTTATWEYSTDLFEAATVESLGRQYLRLLESIVSAPQSCISALRLTSEAERGELLSTHSPTPRLSTLSITERFERQASQRPDAIALTHGDEHLTYGELNERANCLAHYLRARGVTTEMRVGIYMDRTPNQLVAILGTLKAGAAYVPLDPVYPGDRLRFIIDDSAPAFVITESALAGALGEICAAQIVLDESWPEITAASSENPADAPTVGQMAYIIYTSGSTGKPKGVQVSHQNVVQLLDSTHDYYGFDESDVWTLFHSTAFDFSVWEIWGALLFGGRLVIVPYFVSRSPEAFYQSLASERVTVLNQTPTAFAQLMSAESRVGPLPLSLKWIIFGGEALDPRSLEPWFAVHGDEQPRIVNMYGITETTVHVTWRRITRRDTASGSLIGQAIPGWTVYVLDQHMEPAPLGVVGEMYVGGAGVARGYWNRPELTPLRFVPDPFSSEPGAKLYRSGDLARWIRPGELEYIGRADHQVKIRGFRIELGEIEAAIRDAAGVRDVVVVVRESDTGDKRIVAYVVPGSASETSFASLRPELKKRLPDYMIPEAFVTIEAIPLTANGKLDRRALPAPEISRNEQREDHVAPRNAAEEKLAGIWRDVLALQHVSVNENFFDLGGHSLLIARVQTRLKEDFGKDVRIVDLFRHPTISSLASFLASQSGEDTTVASAQERARSRRDRLTRQNSNRQRRREADAQVGVLDE